MKKVFSLSLLAATALVSVAALAAEPAANAAPAAAPAAAAQAEQKAELSKDGKEVLVGGKKAQDGTFSVADEKGESWKVTVKAGQIVSKEQQKKAEQQGKNAAAPESKLAPAAGGNKRPEGSQAR